MRDGQSGQALILVLIFLLVGSILLVPTLDRIGTALKTNVKYEKKSDALYAADAGIDDGIWQVKYGGLQPKFGGADDYEYDFSSNASYQLDNPVNGLATDVTIQNIWIPSNITLGDLDLSAGDAKKIIDDGKLVVSGTAGAVVGQPYRIKIDFVPASGDNLTIKSVGVWLPEGFTFVAGNSTLEQTGHSYTKIPTVTDHCGGQAIVWSYNSPYPLFTSFPNFVSDNGTYTSSIYFSYRPPANDPTKMPTGIAWVTTQMADSTGAPKADWEEPENVPISWDVDTRIYKIDSVAGGTKVEAYTSKMELHTLGDAACGDYVAVGNSLMNNPYNHYYRTLLSSSDATVSTIPANGDVLNAYLYWSGWRNDGTTIFTDSCSDFSDWDRSCQNRVPIADNTTIGTWNTAPCWDDVNKTTTNDTTYMTGVTDTGASILFNFSPFTIPAGSTITDLTIYIRAKDSSSTGTNNIRPYLKVNGTTYSDTFTGDNPGSSFTTYSYSYTTNPNTGAAWTTDDINGAGTHPLQLFGVYSNDLSPDINISMVYAQVNYSRWTISSGQFRGQGLATADTASQTLTLKNGIDIHSYSAGTIAVSWSQSESGTLESTDALYYAISGDGGATWSSNYLVFRDDDPHAYGSFIVPAAYMTSNFKIRFYFNFNDSAEYIYLDNITVQHVLPDTSVVFKINGQQVSLDAGGEPQLGGEVTSGTSQVIINSSGFSYACKADVSKLVKKYPVVAGEQHHNGDATYTVGSVTAITGNEISYAGWSLIIVYFSPETAGHYLYLRDVFSYTVGGEDLDFDGDGNPGGDVTGFVIPEPIRDQNGNITETNAATLTCFVGEGDSWYAGDFVALNAPSTYYLSQPPNPEDIPDSYKLWDGITITSPTPVNTAASPNNVWNSQSIGVSEPGIDIDKFNVTWASQSLKPGDTKLHLDMYTNVDQWNLIYMILSVRSKVSIGGTDHYIISDNG